MGLLLPGDQKQSYALHDWLEVAKRRLRRRTWIGYESLVRVHAIPALGRQRLARLEPRHLEQLYAEKLATGLSPRTVPHPHMCLHRALGQAARLGLALRNVADLVDAPRVGRTEMKTLTLEQSQTFLAAAATPHQALYVLAISSGMRIGELSSLLETILWLRPRARARPRSSLIGLLPFCANR